MHNVVSQSYRWVMVILTKSFLWLSCLKSIRNSVIINFTAKELRVKATKTLNVISWHNKRGFPYTRGRPRGWVSNIDSCDLLPHKPIQKLWTGQISWYYTERKERKKKTKVVFVHTRKFYIHSHNGKTKNNLTIWQLRWNRSLFIRGKMLVPVGDKIFLCRRFLLMK